MDAKTHLGGAIRQIRESLRMSQEKLAANAGITYQYLSSLENGKENFTIGVLESLAASLGTAVAPLVTHAFATNRTLPPKINPEYIIDKAPLPRKLTPHHIENALNETQSVIRMVNATLTQTAGRPLSGYIQKNSFSGIVSNVLCDAFSRLTPYKHNHEQRYPDLVCRPTRTGPSVGLEVKTTIRPGKGGESHNGHSGWHLVACFQLNEKSGDIRFIHIMFADLIGHGKPRSDWKYLGSKVNTTSGSQRTETYITTSRGTAKLRHGTVYLDPEAVNWSRWRTDQSVKAPIDSPFQKNKNSG